MNHHNHNMRVVMPRITESDFNGYTCHYTESGPQLAHEEYDDAREDMINYIDQRINTIARELTGLLDYKRFLENE